MVDYGCSKVSIPVDNYIVPGVSAMVSDWHGITSIHGRCGIIGGYVCNHSQQSCVLPSFQACVSNDQMLLQQLDTVIMFVKDAKCVHVRSNV